jgi:hypothetical protein
MGHVHGTDYFNITSGGVHDFQNDGGMDFGLFSRPGHRSRRRLPTVLASERAR